MDTVIIGGGPSVAYIDTRLLAGRSVIGLNMAYKLPHWRGTLFVKDPRVCEKLLADPDWQTWNRKTDKEGNRVNKTVFVQRSKQQRYGGMEPIHESEIYIGDTTAVSAMDYAAQQGATSLTMIGFDGGFRGGRHHFHDEYPDNWVRTEEKYAEHRNEISAYGQVIEGKGCQVYLADPSRTILITAFTPEYEEHYEELHKSALQFGRIVVKTKLESVGRWVDNAALKAQVILDSLHNLWPNPVCWIDADARIRQNPVLLDSLSWTGSDIALHRRNSTRKAYDGELLSGTAWFNNTVGARAALSYWIREIDRNPGVFDQKLLDQILKTPAMGAIGLKGYELPPEYCCFDLVCQYDGVEEEDAVIWHTQASRTLRKVVDNGS
jgi:hypothetical protein